MEIPRPSVEMRMRVLDAQAALGQENRLRESACACRLLKKVVCGLWVKKVVFFDAFVRMLAGKEEKGLKSQVSK